MTGFPCNSGCSCRLNGRLLAAAGITLGLALVSPAAESRADSLLLALSTPTDLTPAPADQVPAEPPPANSPSVTPPANNLPSNKTINATPLPPINGQPPVNQSPVNQPAGQPAGQLPQPGAALPGAMPQTAPMPTAATPAGGAVTGGAVGLLDDAHNGLGPNMWQGSQLSFLMQQMPKLPAPVSVPALRDLQLRLLLTAAAAPDAIGGLDPLVALRAERLHAMGFDVEALALTKAGADAGPMYPQEAVEKLLNADDTQGACAKVDEQIGKSQTPDLYWRKALIFCQILRDNADQAIIGLDLLRERGDQDQSTKDFIAVASILSGDTKSKKLKTPVKEADPLLAAMLRQAKLPVPDMAASGPPKPVGPAADAALARDPKQPLATRIATAERAFGAGLFKAEDVTALYMQAPPPSGDPVAMINAADTPENRAALYQAVSRGQMPDARAPLINAAMQKARQRGDFLIQAQFYAPFAQLIVPIR